MFSDIINRQAFEITCKTETTARRVKHVIESHTAIQFSNIIMIVLSAAGSKNDYLKIDKLEIDLGDILVDEFGNLDIACQFKNIFQQKIDEFKISQPNKSKLVNGNKVRHDFSDENNTELELLQLFIATGDVPWWVNKSNVLHIDAIINKLLHHQPEVLKNIIKLNWDKPELLARLYAQISHMSLKKINEIMPEFSEVEHRRKLVDVSLQIQINQLTSDQQLQIKKILKVYGQKSLEKMRCLLIVQLVKLYDHLFKNNLSIVETGLENLLLQYGSIHKLEEGKNNHFNKRTIKLFFSDVVKRLSIFEVEILAFKLSAYFVGIFNEVISINFTNEIETSPIYNDAQSQIFKADASVLKEADKSIHINQLKNIDSYLDGTLSQKEDSSNMLYEVQAGDLILQNRKVVLKPEEPVINETGNREMEMETEILINITTEKNILNNKISNKVSNDNGFVKKNVHTLSTDVLTPNEPIKSILYALELKINKSVKFILRKLKSADKGLIEDLQQLSENQLKQLVLIFKKRIIEVRQYKKMLNQLLNHNSFISNNILRIFANLITRKELPVRNKINKSINNNSTKKQQNNNGNITQQSTPANIISIFNELSSRDFTVVNEVFQKKKIETSEVKRIFKKIVQQLPQQDVLLIKYLTELPQQSINKLQEFVIQPSVIEVSNVRNLTVGNEPQNETQFIHIENAGLCLLAAYLPGFFRQLGYLENGKFKNKYFATRAVCLLQYIVVGTGKRAEYLLQFNKILCSLEPDDIVINNIHLNKKEKQEADNLLASIIQNWKTLKSTTLNGFRTSFLQRKGIITLTANTWIIKVEKKSFDILLDSIPWSFNMIKLSWTKKIIQVEW